VAPHAPAGIPVLVAALAAIVAGLLPPRGTRKRDVLGNPSTPSDDEAPP
jgi:hypothetical protein